MKRIFLIAIVFMALVGCSSSEPPEEQKVVRIGTNVWPGYEPLYLANHLSAWGSSELRLIEYPSASEVIRAFRNKTLEAASLTLDEVLSLKQQNIPVSVVLVHDISEGGDVIIAHSGIENIQQLKGKRIGVESGALGAYVISRALEKNGMALADVSIVNRDINMHENAFLNDEVDAVVTFEPVRTRLLSAGGNEVFTSKDIPGEIVDVLVVHQDVLNKYPERIHKLVNAWFDALAYMEKDMQGAAQIMAKRLKITPEEVISSYEGLVLPDVKQNYQILGEESPTIVSTLNKLNRVMLDHKLLSSEVNVQGLYTDAFLPQ